MRITALAIAIGALALAGTATGQSMQAQTDRGKTNPAGTGGDDIPGTAGGWAPKYDSNGRMGEKSYRTQLARSIAEAQELAGQPLADRDRSKIRDAIRGDLIAWRRQYDPRRSEYRDMHDRWLVDEASLSPEGWAKQRADWLRAQQQWIFANRGGEEANRAR